MKYDFDTPVNRRNTNSLKWEVAKEELPMWVADMDFPAAPEIREAMQKRMDHGIFGYSVIPDAWYEAYLGWWERRHGFVMEKEWLHFCTGVMPAVSSLVRGFAAPGGKVLVQTPVYHCFFQVIQKAGRQVLENPLIYEKGAYRMDFADLEEKLSDPRTAMMILCNPQNPGGKIWDRETLGRVGELCAKYHVPVLSDEIHCDLTDPGCGYIPFASVSDACRENSLTCMAPTKAFNLAGLQTAAVLVPNPELREKAWAELGINEAAEPGIFAVDAAVAAFTRGEEWLDQLRQYVYGNKKLVQEFLEREIPAIRAVPSQATYLLWLDCNGLPGEGLGFASFLRARTGLYLSPGESFGGNGAHFLRMNLACPRAVLEEGLRRLREGAEAWQR